MKIRRYEELSNLKGLLREKKYSYRKLAISISISVDALNNKLNGYSVFCLNEVIEIAEELDIEPTEIVKYFFPHMLRNVINA